MSTYVTVDARLATPVLLALFTLLSSSALSHAQAPSSSADGPDDSWREQGTTALAADEYHVFSSEDGVQAANHVHSFRTYFREDGITLVPQTSASPSGAFTWRTIAWGDVGDPRTLGPATIQHAGTRVEYVYQDGLVEWYENGPRGLEQGFLIPRRLSGSGRLVVVGRIPENLRSEVSASGRDLMLSDGEQGNAAVLRYAELHVVDSSGKEVPSQLTTAHGAIEILIDDRGAFYPLTVDPLMTTPAWTAESNLGNFALGESVASAGDVNGDTYDEVICGSSYYRRALLWYGSASGLGPNGTPDNADWSASDPEGDSFFGFSLASAGDINGDSFGDVIIGAAFTGFPTADFGRAYVWYGSASGLGPNGTPDNAHWRATGTDHSNLGYDVASAGDVNGDGYDDVIISSSGYSNGQTFEGGAFVWYGLAHSD